MDNTKSSIKSRFIVVAVVIAAWVYSMFPLKNGDFFAHIDKESKSNIASKTVTDEVHKKIGDELKEAFIRKNKINNRKNREAYNEALDAWTDAISKKEAENFNKAFAKAKENHANKVKKNETDPMPMSRALALEDAMEGIQLYKFIDTPGYEPENRMVTKHVEKIIAGKIKAGIDLQGGVEFTMSFDLDQLKGKGANNTDLDPEPTRDTVIEILRNRIDSKGLAEVELRPFSNNAIMIRVPNVNESEVASIRKVLKQQAKLEFMLKVNPGTPGSIQIPYKDSRRGSITVLEDVLMTGENIKSASAGIDENGMWVVHKNFNVRGAAEFGKITTQYVGKNIAIVLDRHCYSAPTIRTPITGGSAQIDGMDNQEEAEELAIVLQSGAMPVELTFDGESRTDPTLGEASVKSGIISCLAGLALVLVFMVIYYKKPGVIAVLALVANIVLVIGSMAILGATFTLPGIAGIILTIGMAVDTNVLIFERIREELSSGKTLFNSTREGFGRAFITIFDANVTTLITALILMRFGSGPIQGFAYTLAIGIIASMFTGIFMSRIFFDVMTQDHARKELAGFAPKPPKTFDFWILRKKAVVVSAILILIAVGSLIGKGGDAFSVDFAGGNALIYEVTDDVSSQDIEKKLEAAKFNSPRVVVKSMMAGTGKQLEVVVREGHKKFDDVSSNEELYTKIDAVVRDGKTVEDMPRVGQQSVGGVVGDEFRKQAVMAIVLSLIGIFIYITLRFESIFAVGAITALFHDTVIAVGIFVLLGNQISLPVIAAMLTIIGYSLNDTIVVFDRIRENSGEIKKVSIVDLMNVSINGTLNRTILTSLTTLIVVVILTIFGGGAISDFALILVIGVMIGTYSSVFVAAPIVCNRKLSGQLEKIHQEKVDREDRLKNDQTVMAE